MRNAHDQKGYWRVSPIVDGYAIHVMLPTSELKAYMRYLADSPMTDPHMSLSHPNLINEINEYGVQYPISVHTDGTHAIIDDGKHRVRAAEGLGISDLPVIVTRKPQFPPAAHAAWMRNPVGTSLRQYLDHAQ